MMSLPGPPAPAGIFDNPGCNVPLQLHSQIESQATSNWLYHAQITLYDIDCSIFI